MFCIPLFSVLAIVEASNPGFDIDRIRSDILHISFDSSRSCFDLGGIDFDVENRVTVKILELVRHKSYHRGVK